MRIFFNTVVIQIFLTGYIFWRGYKLLPNNKILRNVLITIFFLEVVLYFGGFFFSADLPLLWTRVTAMVGTLWMVFVGCFSLLQGSYDLLAWINRKKHILPKSWDLDGLKTRRIFYVLCLVLISAIFIYGNYNFKHPATVELNIKIDKKSSLEKLKVVAAADMHVGFLIDKELLSMQIDKIMEQKPDLILLAGDIIDYDLKSVVEQKMEEEFSRLHAPYGVFAVPGNHEYIELDDEEEEGKIKWLTNLPNIIMLRDSSVLVDSLFYVVGRDDYKNKERLPLADIMQGVDKSYPLLGMCHQPENVNEEVSNGLDLVVYGHTHNGQLFPYNHLVAFRYWLKDSFSYGYRQVGDSHLCVTSGLGLAGPQLRIGTQSEIVVFNVSFD